jgi:hypothetical protein
MSESVTPPIKVGDRVRLTGAPLLRNHGGAVQARRWSRVECQVVSLPTHPGGQFYLHPLTVRPDTRGFHNFYWDASDVFPANIAPDPLVSRDDATDDDERTECDDCGEKIEDGEEESTRDTTVCSDCFDSYFSCNSCDEMCPEDESNYTLYDTSVCDRCRERYYSHCDDCDGYYADDDACEHEHSNQCECEAPRQHFYVRNDGEPPLENDSRAKVTLPSGVISDEGLGAIRRLIVSQAPTITARYDWTEGSEYMRQQQESDKWYMLCSRLVEIGPEWQKRDGNFTKRLSRFAYKNFEIKLDAATMSSVGNIARDHSVAVDFDIEVTRNLNLSAEEFGHEESCWWQSYGESRCALKSNGGFGIRSFNEHDYVSGRAWVLPLTRTADDYYPFAPTLDTMTPDAFMVFNGYGDLSGYAATRLVGHMAGMTYRKVAFHCTPMYVNNESGYLVAPEDIAKDFTDGTVRLSLDHHAVLIDTTKELAHV